jgi:tRNA U34 5-methylaminomethyl-2-thiouridine-forming methyltransferase MnmC
MLNNKEFDMHVKKEKFVTADGSHTFYMPQINEYYHSHHGAIQEAKHVFIKNGLFQFKDFKEITILEIGFGTGLNALLNCIEAEKMNLKLSYIGLEAYPLSEEEYQDLNFCKHIQDENSTHFFNEIHTSNWNDFTKISACFQLKKVKSTVQEFSFDINSIDLIYFDAFGPRVQPEMWTKEIFANLYKSLKKDGVFVTYCAKGQVKRDLKSVGFILETLAGPPGKREMIRCIKQ